ncbi:Uma2 family endonuclease [Streptomyces lonegramiae]|uniref:Uma2 family endonuclease n=1 Tax=Streptomyces lonegramiae TaxID=3075524 RepID=UPI00374E0DF3
MTRLLPRRSGTASVGARVHPNTDGAHDPALIWLYASDCGLKVEAYRKGRARPDGVLAPEGRFAGEGEWSDTDGVLMTVEVTSHDGDTHRGDRGDKPAAYAAAGIPVYLLVDRDACAVVVLVPSRHPLRLHGGESLLPRAGCTVTMSVHVQHCV